MSLNRTLLGAVAGVLALAAAGSAAAQSNLRVVMHSDLKIVDPIWTTAYISRNYGYMVYDTLFALDEQLAVQPQMVRSYEVSDDNLIYTFTLREGFGGTTASRSWPRTRSPRSSAGARRTAWASCSCRSSRA